jgi:hypothetical protein
MSNILTNCCYCYPAATTPPQQQRPQPAERAQAWARVQGQAWQRRPKKVLLPTLRRRQTALALESQAAHTEPKQQAGRQQQKCCKVLGALT